MVCSRVKEEGIRYSVRKIVEPFLTSILSIVLRFIISGVEFSPLIPPVPLYLKKDVCMVTVTIS